MVDPKTFYRDFDELLLKIGSGRTGEGFICSILEQVKTNFGETLHIDKMRLYEERGDEFILSNKFDHPAKVRVRKISKGSVAAKLMLEHGSHVFNREEPDSGFEEVEDEGDTTSASLVIRSPERRWIALFDLKPGWVYEEIIFSLNAIRTALNYRLFSEAIKTEMEQATQIQRSLLPANVPEIKGYEIAVRYQPTEVVGGDLYDFFLLEEDVFGVCVGDASGHGLPAALLVRDCVIGMRMGIERHLKMVHSLEKLNNVIYKSTYSSRFVSLFYGEIEREGHLIFVNAGHPAPFVVSGNTVTDLKATGLILGAVPDTKLHRSFAHIPPNAVFVLYSDGIFERENLEEETFNVERLKELAIANQGKKATEIVDIIYNTVFEFGNRIKWEDDNTLLVIKRINGAT